MRLPAYEITGPHNRANGSVLFITEPLTTPYGGIYTLGSVIPGQEGQPRALAARAAPYVFQGNAALGRDGAPCPTTALLRLPGTTEGG